MIENWKTIPGYEGLYEVSSFGHVKSLEFYRSKRGSLKPSVDMFGYERVVLYKQAEPKTFQVHRLVGVAFLGVKENDKIDHMDGNPGNNSLLNLRVATQAENTRNSRKHRDGSSQYKGVSWDKQMKRWRVRICVNYKKVFQKLFLDEAEAARAYNAEAIKHFGNFFKLNVL